MNLSIHPVNLLSCSCSEKWNLSLAVEKRNLSLGLEQYMVGLIISTLMFLLCRDWTVYPFIAIYLIGNMACS